MSLIIPSEPVTLSAPCKVNLTLDVFAPRPDGFHELDSIVVPLLPPGDEIKVTVRPGPRTIRLICKDHNLPKGPENLAHKAAQSFLDAFLPDAGVTVYIKLEKRLPVQAGLGGGSSDAATVLRALAHLFPEVTDTAHLHSVAAQIGSDVPLFLSDGPVRMRGRGESIEPLSVPLPPLWGVIVKPDVGVPTGPAYALLDALPDRQPGTATERFLAALSQKSDWGMLASMLANDFEDAVLPHYPAVSEAHQAVVAAGAVRTLLCGSGAAVFGLARDRDHTRELTRALVGRFFWVRMAGSYHG